MVYADSDGFTSSNNATVTFDVVGASPTASNGSFSTLHDTTYNGTLTPSPTPTALFLISLTGPTHGSVVVHANGTFTYTPTAHSTGTDSFVFSVSDGTLAANAKPLPSPTTPPSPSTIRDPPSTPLAMGKRSS